MKKSELKFLKNWERSRKNGRVQFMLKAGTIWGIILTVTMSIFQHFAFDFDLTAYLFLGNLFLYLVVGYFLHYLPLWQMNEAKFEKLKSKHPL